MRRRTSYKILCRQVSWQREPGEYSLRPVSRAIGALTKLVLDIFPKVVSEMFQIETRKGESHRADRVRRYNNQESTRMVNSPLRLSDICATSRIEGNHKGWGDVRTR